jgi:hypothetical protein
MNRATSVKQTNGEFFTSSGELRNCKAVMFNECHVFVTGDDGVTMGIPMHLVERINDVKLSLSGV